MTSLSHRISCLLAICLPLVAQPALPHGSINGAVTPDLIPDVIALRLFIGAVAGPAVASTAQTAGAVEIPTPTARQKTKVSSISLNDADTAVLLQSVQYWQSKTSAISGSSAASVSPGVNLDAIAHDILTTLQGNLTSQGFASLMARVRAEKKNMKIISVPDMSSHKH